MVIHMQAPWIDDAGQDSRAMCNDRLVGPAVSVYADQVTCKRCLKMIERAKKRGHKFKDSRGVIGSMARTAKRLFS